MNRARAANGDAPGWMTPEAVLGGQLDRLHDRQFTGNGREPFNPGARLRMVNLNVTEETPASIVWGVYEKPITILGAALTSIDDTVLFAAEGGLLPEVGERCILCLDGTQRRKVTASVLAHDGAQLRLRVGKAHDSRRYYPRIDTPALMRYRVVDTETSCIGMTEKQRAVLSAWSEPIDDLVNLSVDGLAFLSMLALPVGAHVQMRLLLPGDSHSGLELDGTVVRSSPETTDDGEEYQRLAIHLDNVSPETHDILVHYTLEFQSEMLEGLAKPN